MTNRAIDWTALRAAARAALAHAYAPYSGFSVAAAVLAKGGRVFTGVNLENASFGLCVCAERNAIAAAIGAGEREIAALAIVCSADTAAPPCGACRQVLCEFPPAFPIRSYAQDDTHVDAQSDALLPHAFGPSHFKR